MLPGLVSQKVFFVFSNLGEIIKGHKKNGHSQGKSWVVGLYDQRTHKSLYYLMPSAKLLCKPKGRFGKSIKTHIAFDPGNDFLWEAALPSSAGSVPSPLHKWDLDVVISGYPDSIHTLPPNP